MLIIEYENEIRARFKTFLPNVVIWLVLNETRNRLNPKTLETLTFINSSSTKVF